MSTRLEAAREYFERGDFKKAIKDLWYAEAALRGDPDGLREIQRLADEIASRTDGRTQRDAQDVGRVAGGALEQLEGPKPRAAAPLSGEATSRPLSNDAPQAGTAHERVLAGWVTVCIRIFAIAAVLSIIGGIVSGVVLSDNLSPQAHAELEAQGLSPDDVGIDGRDEGVLLVWIIAGLIGASLWVGMAVLLALLRDVSFNVSRLAQRERT
jgi:hypothetical protein